MSEGAIRHIGIVGLGYVGLPLAVAFAKKYHVTGFDNNREKIKAFRQFRDMSGIVDGDLLKNADIHYTWDEEDLETPDFIIVAVPTPIDADHLPDLGPLREASKTVALHIRPGSVIVYESTVYPGATEEFCIPILEQYSHLVCGRDFKVGYSPERVNLGDPAHGIEQVVKLVSAIDLETLELIAEVYGAVIGAGVHKVSSIKIAEAAKIMENTQRDINIAFMNEMSMFLSKMGLDSEEVRRAAGTKWNFLRFAPGLVGGHCIAVDPYYLIEKGERIGCDMPLAKAARSINDNMPAHIAGRILTHLREMGLEPCEATIAVLGITYKENISDLRNSKALELVESLLDRGIRVTVSDPWAAWENLVDTGEIHDADMLVFAVAHREYAALTAEDLKKMLKKDRDIVFDLQNMFSDQDLRKAGLRKLGL